jgi:hypothetical protein
LKTVPKTSSPCPTATHPPAANRKAKNIRILIIIDLMMLQLLSYEFDFTCL